LFEAFLGGFVAGIDVRVVLARQPPVRLFNFVRLGVALNAQGLV